MSARPRPVTATFPPPAFADYQPRSHSYSLSPGSSTASLLSVLDHDSCDSVISDSPDRRVDYNSSASHQNESRKTSSLSAEVPLGGKTQSDVTEQSSSGRGHSRDRLNIPTQRGNKTGTKSGTTPSTKQPLQPQNGSSSDCRQLSAWEEWVLRKAVAERDRQEAELRRQEQQQREAERMRADKERKKAEARVKISDWVEEYDTKLKQERRLERQRCRTDKELKEEKQRSIQSKAADKYKEWLERVKFEEAERLRLQKEKAERERREKEEKQQKNIEAYRKWCEEAKKRPRTAPNSFGYCAGKLKGYYDASALPTPSYVNPIPWHPIDIPQPKPSVRNKSPKRRWNPEKYL